MILVSASPTLAQENSAEELVNELSNPINCTP